MDFKGRQIKPVVAAAHRPTSLLCSADLGCILAPFLLYFRTDMEPNLTDLSIKNVPDEQIEALRERANRNHRSLQGELRAIIDSVVPATSKQKMTIEELSAYVKSLGLTSVDEATKWIREDRDR